MTKIARIVSLSLMILFFIGISQGQETRDVRKAAQFSPNGRVSIDTYKGSIQVIPWDKSEIEIHARIEADGSGRRSRERVEDTEILIDLTSNSARVKTDYEKARRGHDGFFGFLQFESDNLPYVHYTIKVPRTTNLVIKDYKSKTTIDDLQSDVEIETYKGEVAIAKLSGSLALETYKGEARVQFANLSRRSRVETYKGSLEISLPRGKGFELDADLGRHSELRSDFQQVRDRRTDRRRGFDIHTAINGGGPVLRLKTERGEVRLLEN